jgi:hypothetical protein
MRFFLVVAAALLPLSSMAEDLKIAPGQTYVVDENHTQLTVNRLEIGDFARIQFAPGVAAWRLQAAVAVVGDGVVIDGRGVAGQSGVSGVSAEDCMGQINGQAGSHGAPGGDGVSVRLQLAFEQLGSLKILTDGGKGGDGGRGGDGADNSDECLGEKGGNGGAGGDGGVGGSAGGVTVLYRSNGAELQPIDIAQRISVSASGGKGGEAGRGGDGGEGVGGRYVKKKTLTGDRKWLAAAEAGMAGSHGLSAEPGADGMVMIDSLMTAAPAKPRPAVAEKSTADIGDLERRLNALEKRVRALEGRQ